MNSSSAKLHPVQPAIVEEPAAPLRLRHGKLAEPRRCRPAWLRGRRAWLIGAVIVVAVAMTAVLSRHAAPPAAVSDAAGSAQTITVAPVQRGVIRRSLVVTGSLAARDEQPIGAEAGGLAIVEIDVEEGDRVAKGQLLARLDDSVLRAQLAQADAAVAQAEAGLLKSQAMAATAQSDVRRARELIKNGYISSQAAEQRTTTAATAEADVNVSRQALVTAKALRDERAAQRAQTEIHAPTAGIISKRTATLGNVVAVGEQLFRMIRDGEVELRAEAPETDLPLLAAGQEVEIVLDGGSDRRFAGKIRLVGATVDPQTRLGVVYIALPQDPLLKPGMFVRGTVVTGSGETLLAPEGVVVFKDGKPSVFMVGPDNRTRLQRIATGARQDGMVEILDGVAVGDRLALAGAGYLKDRDVVRVEAPVSGAGVAR